MTDAAEVIAGVPDANGNTMLYESDGRRVCDALLSLAPEVYPRRVVLEQESEGGPVVVRVIEQYGTRWWQRWTGEIEQVADDAPPEDGDLLFRLSDVPEEAQP